MRLTWARNCAPRVIRNRRRDLELSIIPADGHGARIRVLFANGRIAHIENNGKDVRELNVAAPLITTLSRKKEERLLVRFDAIPQVLVMQSFRPRISVSSIMTASICRALPRRHLWI